MTFVDLVTGDEVFLDANTFVYHFAPDPAFQVPCADLLQRIANQDLVGYTSTAILSEVAHRLMTIEARARLGWSQGKVVQRLKQNPAIVQSLGRYRTAVENVLLRSQIQILEISPTLILAAATISQQTGLLTNDALLVAVMQDHPPKQTCEPGCRFRPRPRSDALRPGVTPMGPLCQSPLPNKPPEAPKC